MNKANELLRKALGILDMESFELSLQKEIRAHLAAEEGKQEEEPVAYIQRDQLQKAMRSPMLCAVSPEPREDRVGFFLHPSCPQNEETATRSEDVVTEATDQEPVAWMFPEDLERFETNETFAQAYSVKCSNPLESTAPLFLHPSPQSEQRKPLSEEEIDYYLEVDVDQDYTDFEVGFARGVRFAEKHYGVSE